MFEEIQVTEALNKVRGPMPFNWDLNIYRGCGHGCQYCYAMYSHRYLEPGSGSSVNSSFNSPSSSCSSCSSSFFERIYVKTGIAEALEKQLKSRAWNKEVINIGGVCDSYQPAEAKYGLMRSVLELMIEYKNPVIISTKSDLILRDYDLLTELAGLTYVNIAATVTTMDENTRKTLEPSASPSDKRFSVLKKFSNTGAVTGLHLMPILPLLTDSFRNMETIFSLAAEAKVNYILPGTLYLRGETRRHFFTFLSMQFPELLGPYRGLYKKGGLDKTYREEIHGKISFLMDKYHLSTDYMKPMKEKLPGSKQFRLSDF